MTERKDQKIKRILTEAEIAKATPEGHKRPVTRRDFMAYGLLPGISMMLMPSALFSLARLSTAKAAGIDCKDLAASGGPGSVSWPVYILDGAGGLPFEHIFAIGGTNGDPTASGDYATMGWNHADAEMYMGYPCNTRGTRPSQFFQAMEAALGAPALAIAKDKAKIAVTWSNGLADAGQANNHNPMSLCAEVAKAKGIQSMIAALGGKSTNSGGNITAAAFNSAFKPLAIASADSVKNALDVGSLFSGGNAPIPQSVLDNLMKTASKLTSTQVKELSRMSRGQELSEMIYCTSKKYGDAGTGNAPLELDGRLDATIRTIYGVTATTAATDKNAKEATIALNLMNGNALVATSVIDGCDIHDGSATTNQTRAREFGTSVGRMLRAAIEMKKAVFIVLVTDGSASTRANSENWSSDVNYNASVMISYHPDKAIAQVNKGFLGKLGANGGVDTNGDLTFLKRTDSVAATLALNYYSLLNEGNTSRAKSIIIPSLLSESSYSIAQLLKT